MVDVYYYWADSIATINSPSAILGPNDRPVHASTVAATASLVDPILGDPRPLVTPSTVAATASLATAILNGLVVSASPSTVAATATNASVAFGAVTAPVASSSVAATASTATAILGAINAVGLPSTVAATVTDATATIGMRVVTVVPSLCESSIGTVTASLGYPPGQQRHPKYRRPRPFSRRVEMVKGAVVIYSGMCLGGSGHDVWPLRANDRFAGFAVETSRSSDTRQTVQRGGTVQIPVVGVSSAASIGRVVYAIHDDSFTLTQAAGYVPIGRVQAHASGSVCVVAFDADGISWS